MEQLVALSKKKSAPLRTGAAPNPCHVLDVCATRPVY